MGYWTRAETELVINLVGREPATAQVFTNWPRFVSRLERCEGFDARNRWAASDGQIELIGQLALVPYRYLYLRSNLGDSGLREFERHRSELPEPVQTQTDFRLGSGERETLLHACKDEPYWMQCSTDMSWWMKRLDANPYAVLLEELQYAGSEDGGEALMRRYALPLRLLQIRTRRPQLSDEQRAERLARLAG